jgi:hypothetical protein
MMSLDKTGVKHGIDNVAVRNNAHCTLPDDVDQSTYRFIIVAKTAAIHSLCRAKL